MVLLKKKEIQHLYREECHNNSIEKQIGKVETLGTQLYLSIFVNTKHSNDSHQCPILAADFVIFYCGTENEEAIQAGEGRE